MNPDASEFPAEEYERQFAERRERARDRLEGLWVRISIGLLMAIAGACGVADRYQNPAVWVWSFVALTITGVVLASVSAAFAAVLALRHWSVLTGSMIVAGLTPWAVVLAIATIWLLR